MSDPKPPAPAAAKAGGGSRSPVAAKLAKARPESTVTLMIQSGQAPGGLKPVPAQGQGASSKRPALLARAWAAFKSWW